MTERREERSSSRFVPSLLRRARRPDWYVAPAVHRGSVRDVPGVFYRLDGLLEVHRSHLPLLSIEATSGLFPSVPSEQEVATSREAFDARTRAVGGFALREYQHVGREFIRSRSGALLADGCRTGKTATVCCSHDLSDGPLAVVGPLAASEVWHKEFTRRWPEITPLVLKGRRYRPEDVKIAEAQLIFLNYDILPTWQFFGRQRLGMIVLDEAHVVSNVRTDRTQAALVATNQADRIVALTATPLWNKPAGLWPLLACINPGAWGKRIPYCERYASGMPGPHGYVTGPPSHVEEFQERLSEVMLCRQWRDVRDELPPVERCVELIELTEQQEYDLSVAYDSLRDATRSSTPIGELARLRRLLGDLKLSQALAVADRFLSLGESVVVWAWHRDVVDRITHELKIATQRPIFAAHGGHSKALRDQAIRGFQLVAEHEPSACVLSLGVGQSAIDLSCARHAVYAEIDFTPAVIAQSEMRTFSPDRPMDVTFLVADHIVDRAIVRALMYKCQMAQKMGTPAADTAIDLLGEVFEQMDSGDLNRLRDALLAEAVSG